MAEMAASLDGALEAIQVFEECVGPPGGVADSLSFSQGTLLALSGFSVCRRRRRRRLERLWAGGRRAAREVVTAASLGGLLWPWSSARDSNLRPRLDGW